MTDNDSTSDQDDSQLAVYRDLVKLYPEHEGYLRKYADLLIEDGQQSTAREVLRHLHKLLMSQGNIGRANELLGRYPQIGRIRAISEEDRQPVIELLPDEMQSKVWQFVHQQRLKEGHHLFRQGETGDTMYLLLKGELAIFMTPANGKTVLLNLIKPGDVVGEGCLLDPGIRNADVVANKDSTVVKLPRNKVIQALINNPGLEAELKRISDFRYMVSLVSANPLLMKIPLDTRQDMAVETELQSYVTGETIHAAGDRLRAVDMLIRGEAAYTMTLKQSRKILYNLVVGELVGDTAAVRESTCPADLVAISNVTMAHIPYSCFKNAVEAHAPLKEGLISYAELQRERLMRQISALGKAVQK